MKKTGIRKKLVVYFLSIVTILSLISLALLLLHLFIVNRYEQISSNIFNQYKLITTTSDIVASYNVYRNDPSDTSEESYLSHKDLIEKTISGLNETIVNEESRITFAGVKNTIASVIGETDSGIEDIKSGDFEDSTNHFVEANRKFSFVKENTANLILNEVQYSAILQKDVARLNQISFITGGLLLFIIIITAIVASNVWAEKLISPLVKLSNLAGTITGGSIESDVPSDLMKSTDEVGSLAKSFDLMLKKLRGNISKLDNSNKELEESKKRIEENNIYLGKTNKMMVDRELAMIKLKKKIKILMDAGPVSYEVSDKLAQVDREDSIEGLNK